MNNPRKQTFTISFYILLPLILASEGHGSLGGRAPVSVSLYNGDGSHRVGEYIVDILSGSPLVGDKEFFAVAGEGQHIRKVSG